MPLFLLEQNNQLVASLATGLVVSMPSGHVFAHNIERPDVARIAAVIGLVTKRFAEWPRVITNARLRLLGQHTGGDLRDLLRAVRVAIIDDIEPLPVSDSVVQYARGQVSPNETIPSEHVARPARFEASHEAELGGHIDGKVLRL